jgi:hypothetical protein
MKAMFPATLAKFRFPRLLLFILLWTPQFLPLSSQNQTIKKQSSITATPGMIVLVVMLWYRSV